MLTFIFPEALEDEDCINFADTIFYDAETRCNYNTCKHHEFAWIELQRLVRRGFVIKSGRSLSLPQSFLFPAYVFPASRTTCVIDASPLGPGGSELGSKEDIFFRREERFQQLRGCAHACVNMWVRKMSGMCPHWTQIVQQMCNSFRVQGLRIRVSARVKPEHPTAVEFRPLTIPRVWIEGGRKQHGVAGDHSVAAHAHTLRRCARSYRGTPCGIQTSIFHNKKGV